MNPRRTLLCVQSIWVQAVHVKDALLYLCLRVAGVNQCSLVGILYGKLFSADLIPDLFPELLLH